MRGRRRVRLAPCACATRGIVVFIALAQHALARRTLGATAQAVQVVLVWGACEGSDRLENEKCYLLGKVFNK